MNPKPHAPLALITGGDGDLAHAIRNKLESQGWQIRAPTREEMNVTDKAAVQAVIGALPRLDLVIHTAGFLRDALVVKMSESDFDAVIQVHLKGAFLVAQAALKKMLPQKEGHIVNIGSFSALSGPAGQGNYAAAKAGMIALTQSLAAEYGARNIRANCVLPGFLETRMSRGLLEKNRAKVEKSHALGRLNTVEDAARFIAFLQTMENVSGQVFQLDSRIGKWT